MKVKFSFKVFDNLIIFAEYDILYKFITNTRIIFTYKEKVPYLTTKTPIYNSLTPVY